MAISSMIDFISILQSLTHLHDHYCLYKLCHFTIVGIRLEQICVLLDNRMFSVKAVVIGIVKIVKRYNNIE